jgi:hypothetical protein
MPRQLPRFDKELLAEARMAHSVILSGEQSKILNHGDWTPTKIEYLYELAYLRLFSAWETTIESVFLRMMCGHSTRLGRTEVLNSGSYYRSLLDAEMAVLAGRRYVLWHDPGQIITRCQTHFRRRRKSAAPILEAIISSHQSRLNAWAAIRHRIVHEQHDARVRFDMASTMFAGRTYPASRPGKFLKDFDTSLTPPKRWIEIAIIELTGLTRQMV